MDEDGHGAGLEAIGPCAPLVEHALHPLQLDEVVARPSGAQLTRAALARPLRRRRPDRRHRSVPATPCAPGRLRCRCRGAPAGPPGPSRRTRSSSAPFSFRAASRPAPAGRQAGDLVDERLLAVAQLVGCDRGRQQAHAAVDVVADPAWGDDAVGRLGRRQPADRESVALVDVRHRQRRPDHARKRGHVLELLQRAIGADRLEQLLISEHPRGNPHVPPARLPGSPRGSRPAVEAPSSSVGEARGRDVYTSGPRLRMTRARQVSSSSHMPSRW